MSSDNKKVVIASGSRHSIPPVQESPGVPRIIYQLTEKDIEGFQFKIISKYNHALDDTSFDTKKYLHPKPSISTRFYERFLDITSYEWRKKKYGFAQPDRIVYYTALVKMAKKIDPDMVITFMHFELFRMLQEAIPKARHIFFFRSTDLEGRIGKENLEFLLRHSAGFLANTKAPIEELKTKYQNLDIPVETIYNSVPKVGLNLKEQKTIGSAFRKKFGLSATAFVLGYAGRFSEEKSLMKLFVVLKALKEEGVIVHLIIAGDIENEKTPNYEYYRDLMAFKATHLKEQVHLAGWVTHTELFHFYCALDVGVLLSKYREGNSMFLIEAMSYGVPVIATAVGGNKEIITSGINGVLLVPKKMESGLKEHIKNLYFESVKLSTMARNARSYISENHSKEKMIALFQNFLTNIYS